MQRARLDLRLLRSRLDGLTRHSETDVRVE
jgi:hypothetical protein